MTNEKQQECVKLFAASVVKQSILDWRACKRSKDPKAKGDRIILIEFFMSTWFDDLCVLANVDPEWVLEKLDIRWRYLDG